MLRFLFWNLGRRPLSGLVSEIAAQYDVDVIWLAETAEDRDEIARVLSRRSSSRPFHFSRPEPRARVSLFARFPLQFIRVVKDGEYISLRQLNLPGRESLLIGGAHLPGKLFRQDDFHNASHCVELARDVAEQEKRLGHSRTVLVGDFNMNPFESGMASTRGFNAVMSVENAKRGSRTERSIAYPFFYNPMWSHFGDRGPNPPGTYYYGNSTHLWNTFDQVLLRPQLLSRFVEDDLRVLTAAGELPLVRLNGRPDPRAGSDHLPLLFTLEI